MFKNKKTLFSSKKDGSVPTSGIYVKNIHEASSAPDSDISFHKIAEDKTREFFDFLNLEKYEDTEISIDLKGSLAVFFEVERDFATKGWTNETNFPYTQINIPIEKKRHFIEHVGNSFYVKYNSTMSVAFLVYGEDIIKNSKETNMMANHSGHMAERTFLRIDKKYAIFFDLSDTKQIKKWILTKMAG
ncbi:MAG TPA: hypothetical protein PKH95_03615 [Candidatus Magasanikbacteria bacterium]|nr:hypothetical protein [Candidatus Magasanikbacteria bacterium]